MIPPLLCTSALMTCYVRATDWPALQSSYRQLEWVAGLGGETPDNGNEWNDAEGLPARQAELSEPHSAMADLDGNIYVADKNAHAIRRINQDGTLTTVAGVNLEGFDGDGPATARRLSGPQHVYPLPDGTLYILDSGNRRVRRVGLDGWMTTVITDPSPLSRGLWVSRDEAVIYYCTESVLKKWTPALGNAAGVPVATGFSDSGNIDVARNGDIYVADRGSSRVYRVRAAGDISFPPLPVAGTGGTTNSGPAASGNAAVAVGLREARGVAFHPLGGYFVCCHRGGDVWYVDTAGKAWMFIEGDDNKVHFTDPVAVPTPAKAISEPRSISVALNGDILIATNDAGYIKRVRYTGPPPPGPEDLFLTGNPENGFELKWTPGPGSHFRVESTSRPGLPAWSNGALTLSYGSPPIWFTGPQEPAGSRFFRIREIRAWPN